MECDFGDIRSRSSFGFVVWDYIVFAVVLSISAGIGTYFAYKSRKEATTTVNYLLGGRNMTFLPVALSVNASTISAIAVIGSPAEFYANGTMYWWIIFAVPIAAVVASEIYIPVLYRLGITSVNEYLERRFNKSVRMLMTTVFLINTLLYDGIVIYAPSLAVNQVTGLHIWLSAAIITAVCTFYTTLGGLKAVIWTDVFQCIVMWIGFFAILIRGSMVLGGFRNIWSLASKGGRVELSNFQFDPTIRHTSFSLSIGGSFIFSASYAARQSMVQRYLSCKSENHARASVLVNVIGWAILLILVGLAGLTMYAYYAGCDPYSAGWVSAKDQLMPYFVMELLHDYPGLPGVFVCAVFSGTLSTLSTGMNSMATVTIEDYLQPFKKFTPAQSVILSKVLVVIFGGVCMLMALLAAKLGEIQQAALSINGIVGGPLLATFTLGVLFPWCNSIGAFVGTLSGLACSTWIFVGSKIYPQASSIGLPLCTTMCNTTSSKACGITGEDTTTASLTTAVSTSEIMAESRPSIAALYSISYLYYPVFGFCVTVVAGLIISFITGYQRPSEVDPATICAVFDHPFFFWIPKKVKRFLWCGVRHDQKKILYEVKNFSRPPQPDRYRNLGQDQWDQQLEIKNELGIIRTAAANPGFQPPGGWQKRETTTKF